MSNEDRVIRPAGPQRVAPLVAASVPLAQNALESYLRMQGMLRDIRAEVQNLRLTLTRLIEKEGLADANIRTLEILVTLKNNLELYTYNVNQIKTRLDELKTLTRESPMLYDRYGDEIVHIENAWERVTYNWPQFTGDLPEDSSTVDEALIIRADEVLRLAKRIIDEMDVLIYHAALLTIPGRLNQHLEQLRIGRSLDFHTTFSDEVPREEDRQKILEYLYARPVAVPNGIIDAAKGVVYHAAASAARRRFSYILITLTAVLGGLLVILASELGTLFEIDNWPLDSNQTTRLLVAYGFVLLGTIVHIGIDAIKQARGSQWGSVLALEDWLLWVHINETGIIVGVVSVWIGFFGILFLSGDVDWQTAFLVGYSIDSFVDIFLQRFDTFSTSRTAAIPV